MDTNCEKYDKIILGIDPGTNVMGYGLLGVKNKKPEMIAMGVIELSKLADHYHRLSRIYERIAGLVDNYKPDEMAIEAPFFGKNVQSMLKLGRAQGVAIAAALSRNIKITEYEPRKIKMAITGNGGASKEQVQEMLKRILKISEKSILPQLDASDALAAALCHFYETSKPILLKNSAKSWKEFVTNNPDKISNPKK